MLTDCSVQDVTNNYMDSGYTVGMLEGNSMSPLLKKGDIAVIRSGKESLKTGDIILYIQGEKQILHRIIKIEPLFYLVAGDHCVTLEKVAKQQIVGKMEFVLREGKKIFPDKWYMKPYVFLWGRRPSVRRLIAVCVRTLKNKWEILSKRENA